MRNALRIIAMFAVWLSVAFPAQAQDSSIEDGVERPAKEAVPSTRDKVDEVAEKVDESKKAQEASAGILKSIYTLAEYLSFPTFHWIAFSMMVAGVVSFALQLVLGKLIVLSKRGFSLTEILSDGLGLAISLVGLVLTTQAAAENSTFTQSPAAVLSSAAVGVVVGFVFFLWGLSQEVQAVRGRK